MNGGFSEKRRKWPPLAYFEREKNPLQERKKQSASPARAQRDHQKDPGTTRRPPMCSNRNTQGGKAFGELKAQQEDFLDTLNKEFLDDPKYSTDEDLAEKLEIFKKKYMDFDLNAQGDIDIMALKRMLEKLGAAKTHLELKKMITEVTGGMSETISYRDFVRMMLGKRSAIFKIILMYEEKAKEKEEKPAGPPPKKIIADLP